MGRCLAGAGGSDQQGPGEMGLSGSYSEAGEGPPRGWSTAGHSRHLVLLQGAFAGTPAPSSHSWRAQTPRAAPNSQANSLILLHKRPDQACWASLQNPSQNLLIKCSQPRISRALTPQVCVLSTVFREASWRPLKDYLLLESSISIPPGSRPKPEDRERCLVESEQENEPSDGPASSWTSVRSRVLQTLEAADKPAYPFQGFPFAFAPVLL